MSPSQPGPKGPDHAQAGAPDASTTDAPRYLEADPREAARFLAVTNTPAQVATLAAFLDLLASIDPTLRHAANDLKTVAGELRSYVRASGEG